MKATVKAIALSLAVAALALGCSKDKKKDGEGGEAGKSGEVAGGGQAAAGGGGGASLSLFPADSNLLVGVNVANLRQSKLWSKFWPMIEQQGGEDLAKFKTTCGIDPATALNSITVGGNVGKDDSMVVTIGTAGVAQDKAVECVKKMAEAEGEKVEVTTEGKFVGIKEGDDTQWLAWADANTIVTGPKAENDKAWLEGRLSGQESVKSNQAFMGLVGKVDTGSTVWIAMQPPADDNPFSGMPGGAQPTALYANVQLSKGLKMHAGLVYANADDAKKTADQANQMMGPMAQDPNFGKFAKKIKVTTAGNDMVVDIDLNEQEFDELLAMVQQQLPMLMMMMGGGGM